MYNEKTRTNEHKDRESVLRTLEGHQTTCLLFDIDSRKKSLMLSVTQG